MRVSLWRRDIQPVIRPSFPAQGPSNLSPGRQEMEEQILSKYSLYLSSAGHSSKERSASPSQRPKFGPAALQLPCCPGRTLPRYRLATHFVRSQVLQGRLCHLGTHTFDSFYTGREASSCRGRAALGGPCGPPHALHCSSNQILLQISCLAFPEDIVPVITLFYQEVGRQISTKRSLAIATLRRADKPVLFLLVKTS